MQNCYKGNKFLLPKMIYQFEKGVVENPTSRACQSLAMPPAEHAGRPLRVGISSQRFSSHSPLSRGLSFWKKPFSLGWATGLRKEPERQTLAEHWETAGLRRGDLQRGDLRRGHPQRGRGLPGDQENSRLNPSPTLLGWKQLHWAICQEGPGKISL